MPQERNPTGAPTTLRGMRELVAPMLPAVAGTTRARPLPNVGGLAARSKRQGLLGRDGQLSQVRCRPRPKRQSEPSIATCRPLTLEVSGAGRTDWKNASD